ncbi:MAG: hypothetical protein ABL931_23370, partial [Usitatibacteraceae bacterium]
MSSLAKLFIALALIAIAGLILIGGSAWYWWDRNSEQFLDASKTAIADGQKSGAELDEQGCMNNALTHHRDGARDSFVAALRNNLWLTGCLNASRPVSQFCADVPRQSDVVAGGIW